MIKSMLFDFRSKLSLAAIMCTLIWVAIDLDGRLFGQHKKNTQNTKQVKVSSVVLPIVSAELVVTIDNLYSKYREDAEEDTVTSFTMTKEQQALQSGQQTTFFVNDNTLRLKAVLQTEMETESKKYALIEVTNVKTQKTTIEKFADLTNVYGYKMSITSNTQVSLRKQKQLVTLSMYKV